MTKEITKIDLNDEKSISTILADKAAIVLIKSALEETVKFSKSLEIKDYSNKSQFDIVKRQKQDYVGIRNNLKRVCKSERDKYRVEAQKWMDTQNELIETIQEEEDRLGNMVKEANKRKLIEENKLKLQSRKDQLKEYNCELSDDELLIMKDKEFFEKLQEVKEIYLEEKERQLKLKEEKQRIEEEKRKAVEEARKAEQEKARQAAEEAKIKAEQDRINAIEEEKRKSKEAEEKAEREKQEIKRKAEEEKQILIAEQEKSEQDRIAEEKRLEDEKKAEQEAKKKEDEKIAKRKKYQVWLKDNEFNEDNFLLKKTENSVIMYKKISEFNFTNLTK